MEYFFKSHEVGLGAVNLKKNATVYYLLLDWYESTSMVPRLNLTPS